MGNRLSKIVTKTGDDGTTGLGDGSRIPKTHSRIEAIGDIDELNCFIGLILADKSLEYDEILTEIHHRLFDVGGELSIPGYTIIDDGDVAKLEIWIAETNNVLPPLKNFILPGGSELLAKIHIARAVARRAERSIIRLLEDESVNSYTRQYLNRLSDLFFVMARAVAGGNEVLWQPKPKPETDTQTKKKQKGQPDSAS